MSNRVDAFLAMLARGQDSALLRYSLGNEMLSVGRTDEAIEHLRHALEQDADYSAAWRLLGKALTEAGQVDDAMDVYRRGIATATDNGDVQAAKEMQVFLKRLEKSIS